MRPLKLTVLHALGLDPAALAAAREAEVRMQAADAEIERAHAAKNDLEAEIYAARAAVDVRTPRLQPHGTPWDPTPLRP